LTVAAPSAAQQAYSRDEVLRFLHLSERQLKQWEEQGFIASRSSFGFPELLALRTLMQLRASRVSAARIKEALNALREKVRDGSDPLTKLRIYAEELPSKKSGSVKTRIRVEIDGRTMIPHTGQLLLDFSNSDIDKLLAFPARRHSREQDLELRTRAEAERWFERALELERAGAPVAEVREAYEKTLSLDPTSTGALVNLGTIYYNSRTLQKAEQYYRRAIEADPEYALAHFNLGNLHDERGDRDLARLHYERSLEINPAYPDAHYNLALLYQNSGQIMKAVRHWKAYLKLDPGSSWAAVARRELDKLKGAALIHGGAQ
jgi:tetratricopeptide (TPR) repeat protein